MPRPKRSPTSTLSIAEEEQQRTNFLLDVAARAFIEMGYAKTTIAEIASRAKASKQSFYKRYPRKEDLFLAVLQREIEQVFSRFDLAFQPKSTIREELETFAQVIIVDLLLLPKHIDLLRIVSSESNRFPEVASKFITDGPTQGIQQLAAYLSEQTLRGRLSIEDPILAAEQFFHLVGGEMMRQALLGQHVEPKSPENKHRVQGGINVFLNAYERRPGNTQTRPEPMS